MSRLILGLDTSNYRTSVAAVTVDGQVLFNARKLLPVPLGERGLRQSDAVFLHLKQMRGMIDDLREVTQDGRVAAVCASTRPRSRDESYMPVFQVGDAIGCSMAAAMDVPYFLTDHQHGHIAAAAHETALEGESSFLALHLSGGTTDLLFKNGEQLETLGGSKDLQIGQLVDRVGVAMGLSFPAGPELEKLAEAGRAEGLLGCSMEDGDLRCHFSGAETRAGQWIAEARMPREDIAREIYDLMARTVARMLAAGCRKTGQARTLITGGVAASALFRNMLQRRVAARTPGLRLVFGRPEYSGDNAVGVALIGAERLRKLEKDHCVAERNPEKAPGWEDENGCKTAGRKKAFPGAAGTDCGAGCEAEAKGHCPGAGGDPGRE